MNNFINILYTNANGLRNKITELQTASDLYNFHILCITETKINNDIFDAEIHLYNYDVFRKDRSTGQEGGGSAIYVHKQLMASLLKTFEAPDSLAILLNNEHVNLVIVCVYRSQALSHHENCIIIKQIQKIRVDYSQEIFLVGDFNLPQLCWKTGIVKAPHDTIDKNLLMQKLFLNAFQTKGLSWQLINGEITRRRCLEDGTIQESSLDQVLVTNPSIVRNVKIVPAFGKSDHLSILTQLQLCSDFRFFRSVKEVWGRFQPESIIDISSSIDWNYSSPDLGVEEMWSELFGKLMKVSENVPKIEVKCDSKGTVIQKVPWDCTSLKRKKREKDNAWSIFDSEPIPKNLNFALAKNIEFELKQTKCMVNYEKKITSNMRGNPKRFFSYLNSKRKIKNSVTVVKDSNGALCQSPQESSDILADFFSSTFVEEPFGPLNKTSYQECIDQIEDLVISEQDVLNIIEKMDTSKSVGPDNVHPKLISNLSKNKDFVKALTELYRQCYGSSYIPNVWKTAHVTAIHKKGCKSDAQNYRPVSLTCILCKVYEKIVRSHILAHVAPKIVPNQHGFTSGKSCLSNLLEFIDVANELIAAGECVDIFYMDFQKAFDTVPHYRLITKLKNLGIGGKTLSMISDFLSGRSFQVKVGDSLSETHEVTSGVPQGSVIGPLLFLIYINDLPDQIINYISLFADDVKMLTKSSAALTNQQDINKLLEWQDTWLLRFNVQDEKCKVLHVGKANPQHTYYIGDSQLPAVSFEKDLGVYVSNNLNWDDHIHKSIAKANSIVAWVNRSVICRTPEVMLNIYVTLVRPHLEYCVQLWAPVAKYGNWSIIMDLESVQRSFTRSIEGIGLLNYEERLQKLDLTTLLERRARGDLIEAFKILSGISSYGNKFFRLSRSGLNLLMPTGAQSTMQLDFFSRRVVKHWNKLPQYVINSTTVDNFKANLQKHKVTSIRYPTVSNSGNYWSLSQEVFNRINDSSRDSYTSFMMDNPHIARRKRINIHS